MKFDLILKNLL